MSASDPGKLDRIGGDRLIEAQLAEGIGDTEWQAGQRANSLTAYRKSLQGKLECTGPLFWNVKRA